MSNESIEHHRFKVGDHEFEEAEDWSDNPSTDHPWTYDNALLATLGLQGHGKVMK